MSLSTSSIPYVSRQSGLKIRDNLDFRMEAGTKNAGSRHERGRVSQLVNALTGQLRELGGKPDGFAGCGRYRYGQPIQSVGDDLFDTPPAHAPADRLVDDALSGPPVGLLNAVHIHRERLVERVEPRREQIVERSQTQCA